jgi:chromate transport protein ChrA
LETVAVYLGALALHSPLGAAISYLGIFLPDLMLSLGAQSIWRVLRTNPAVVSLLRGVNATAVGLVFTAVYRLWEIGFLGGGGSASPVGILGGLWLWLWGLRIRL